MTSRPTTPASSTSAAARLMSRAGDPEVVGDLAAHLGERPVVDEHVVHRRRLAVGLDAEVGGGVGLRVEVEDADALAGLGQGGGEVDRGGRLADAALLVDDRDPSHGSPSSVGIDGRSYPNRPLIPRRSFALLVRPLRPGWLGL